MDGTGVGGTGVGGTGVGGTGVGGILLQTGLHVHPNSTWQLKHPSLGKLFPS